MTAGDDVQLVAFRVAGQEFAFHIFQVERILRYEPPAPLPRAPEFLEGVLRHEGAAVPVIDLRKRLSVAAPLREDTRTMILEWDGSRIGLVVDAVTEVLQVALLTVIALALGWSPQGNPLAVAGLLVLGTAAFSGLGLLMAGTLKAEATLAGANLVFVLLLLVGGVVVPLSRFPEAVRPVLELLTEFQAAGEFLIGDLRLVIPFTSLEPFLERFGRDSVLQLEPGSMRAKVAAVVDEIPVDLSAEIGSTAIRLRQLMELQPGDVIPLNARVGEPAVIPVMGKPKFRAHIGRIGNRFGARVADVIDQ